MTSSLLPLLPVLLILLGMFVVEALQHCGGLKILLLSGVIVMTTVGGLFVLCEAGFPFSTAAFFCIAGWLLFMMTRPLIHFIRAQWWTLFAQPADNASGFSVRPLPFTTELNMNLLRSLIDWVSCLFSRARCVLHLEAEVPGIGREAALSELELHCGMKLGHHCTCYGPSSMKQALETQDHRGVKRPTADEFRNALDFYLGMMAERDEGSGTKRT